MSTPIVQVKNLSKKYRQKEALKSVNFTINSGRIVGLIGPNGAGKTTILKALLGLTSNTGEIAIFGKDPSNERTKMLENVSFISDTAILPRWMKVSQVIDYASGVHSNFNKEKALSTINESSIKLNNKVSQLSKGMVTQLHLALIMAIDAKLLILDEPTLGLDIIERKKFYRRLLEDYFDRDKTILITTHQVEEVEHILTDLIFINEGQVALTDSIEHITARYVEVEVSKENLEMARQLKPFYEAASIVGANFIFETDSNHEFARLGKTKIPSIADLFIATVNHNKELTL